VDSGGPPLKGYSTGEVARILELTPRQVRSCVRAGILEPERGPRREFRFSFQDLVYLKTARGLFAARMPASRVRGTLEKLRQQLPRGRRLSGVHIAVEDKRIVVSDGSARWQPESGQILFDFGVADLARRAAPVARLAFAEAKAEGGDPLTAEEWYRWGCELEAAAPEEAAQAYRRALALDPRHADAHVNLGRLVHESGDAETARQHYCRALDCRPDDATAAFNLGVALEDLGRPREALAAYENALALDARNADAHYNAASLCERLGQPADALRHLKDYRGLTLGRPR
jgi:tetratricopeptide (TPR) repeat protein